MTRSPWKRLVSAGALVLTLAPAVAQDLPRDEPAPARPSTAPPPSDAAIGRALEYLKLAQKPDGAWEAGGFGRATSITSLAVMAYLASGHVPGEPGPYRETIEKGIRYVLDHQAFSNGLVVSKSSHGPMYCHGISTLMLAEVVGMTADPELAERCRTALARAVKLILLACRNLARSQNHAGGWRLSAHQP